MAKQKEQKPRARGVKKCKEHYVSDLPGCEVYSIRSRPKSFPSYDINYYDWDIVGYNIEKKNERLSLTAYGQTKEEAIQAMQTLLDVAITYRIDTYNGVPGSGLVKTTNDNKVIIDPKDVKIAKQKNTDTEKQSKNKSKKKSEKEEEEEEYTYRVSISVGPWKPKCSKDKHNNNCGRHQIHQEMRKIRISIEQARTYGN